jgi:hypothetical protein
MLHQPCEQAEVAVAFLFAVQNDAPGTSRHFVAPHALVIIVICLISAPSFECVVRIGYRQ